MLIKALVSSYIDHERILNVRHINSARKRKKKKSESVNATASKKAKRSGKTWRMAKKNSGEIISYQ